MVGSIGVIWCEDGDMAGVAPELGQLCAGHCPMYSFADIVCRVQVKEVVSLPRVCIGICVGPKNGVFGVWGVVR